MNETSNVIQFSRDVMYAQIDNAAESLQGESIKALQWRNRQLLKMGDKSDTFYDLKMNDNERGVLLRAAGIDDTPENRKKKLRDFTKIQRQEIKEAAKRASDWAAGLGVA